MANAGDVMGRMLWKLVKGIFKVTFGLIWKGIKALIKHVKAKKAVKAQAEGGEQQQQNDPR